MKNWKNIVVALTALCVVIILSACGSENPLDKHDTSTTTVTATGTTVGNTTTTVSGNGNQNGGGNVKLGDNGGSNAETNVKSWQVPGHAADLNSEYKADTNPTGYTKVEIDNAGRDVWNHRVFNMNLFHAPNWDGADSWFNTLAIGPNSGGFWTSFGNPGEVIYRGNTTHISWCLADLTTSTWNNIDLKKQFLSRGNPSLPVAMNVRIIPNSIVSVKKNDGSVVSQATSDGGDITIVLPDNGVTSVCVDYTTAAPTHESHVWFGPYDRSKDINTIDAR